MRLRDSVNRELLLITMPILERILLFPQLREILTRRILGI
jgi:hypothetical protein